MLGRCRQYGDPRLLEVTKERNGPSGLRDDDDDDVFWCAEVRKHSELTWRHAEKQYQWVTVVFIACKLHSSLVMLLITLSYILANRLFG